jgi:CRISPR-associated protein Csd1
LNRDLLKSAEQKLTQSLDVTRPETAYHLGRLFAELEKLQSDALPELSSAIRDRYLSAASTNPIVAFPALLALSRHHLAKVKPTRSWKRSARAFRLMKEDRVLSITSVIQEIPTSLNLYDQGLFAVGYYHQRQSMYPKSPEASMTPKPNEE